MPTCICPDDGRKVPSDRRVVIFEPNAVVREGNTIKRDMTKVHIFDKQCPVHGYTEITDG